MRKELALSIARKLAILLLLASAVLLTLRTGYFSVPRSAAAEGTPSAVSAPAAAADAILLPRAVMVCFPDGSRAASVYDGEGTEQAFRRFSALLGEALGSAGAPEETSEAEFRAALPEGGVFFDLGMSCPLDLLSDLLGAGGGGAAGRSAGMLYLGISGETVRLWFLDGGWYGCATAAQSEALEARMNGFQAPAASFAWERGPADSADPFAVVPEAMPAIYAVAAASARDAAVPELLADAAGMKAASWYDADGTTVYIEDEKTLRLTPDGTVYYRDPAAGTGAASGLSGAVSRAWRMMERSAGRWCGDARPVLSGAEQAPGTGEYTVYFDYAVRGIPVRLAEGHAGAVTVSGGAVVRAELRLRRYTVLETEETVLPMRQAAAIAASKGGGAPSLVYLDSGGSAPCVWVMD